MSCSSYFSRITYFFDVGITWYFLFPFAAASFLFLFINEIPLFQCYVAASSSLIGWQTTQPEILYIRSINTGVKGPQSRWMTQVGTVQVFILRLKRTSVT